MKLKVLATVFFIAFYNLVFSQTISHGPVLKNDPDDIVNRLIHGDESSFYCYRVRSQGAGTSLILQKYDNNTLSLIFSKELDLDGENKTRFEDMIYLQGKLFLFKKLYKKKEEKMDLFYQTISSDGKVLDTLKDILSVRSNNPALADFDINLNSQETRILVKTTCKSDAKAEWKTEFLLMDVVNQKNLWTKKIDEKKFNDDININSDELKNTGGLGFRGTCLDDEDNFYFGYMSPAKTWTTKKPQFKFSLGIVSENDTVAKKVDLDFDEGYFVESVYLSKINNHEMFIGGYIRDLDPAKCKIGVYSFRVDLTGNKIKASSVKFFDKEFLKKIECNLYNFGSMCLKLDNIFFIDNSVYFIGQKYSDSRSLFSSGLGLSVGGIIPIGPAEWNFKYNDVIIAKLNEKGEFEWIKNIPMNQDVKCEHRPKVFKQYVAYATSNNIYILNNDRKSNFDIYQNPKIVSSNLNSVKTIDAKVLLCNTLNLSSFDIKRTMILDGRDFSLAPIQERNPSFYPPSNYEIFIKGRQKEIFIHTKNGGKDRFSKIKFE